MNKAFSLSVLNSALLVLVFVIPYLVYAKTSLNLKSIIDIILFLLYVLIGIILRKHVFNRKYIRVFIFAAMFVIFAIINQLGNDYFRVYNIIAPLAAYLGYVYVSEKTLSPIPFRILMLFNYIFFYIIYYSVNPISFLIPESEFNVDAFTNTSSNLIPAILIINLYIFDILNVVKFENKEKKVILIFALVNVFLISLQRSRAGIFVSILFLFIKLYENYKKISFLIFIVIAYLTFHFWPLLMAFSEAAGTIDANSYSGDVRKENIDIFFNRMDSVKDAVMGYGRNFEKMTPAVTQNLAITIWNYYTIFPLFVIFILILLRIFKSNYLPISFYSVFVTYSFFEGYFLSNYWDFIIYVLFFYNIIELGKKSVALNYNVK